MILLFIFIIPCNLNYSFYCIDGFILILREIQPDAVCKLRTELGARCDWHFCLLLKYFDEILAVDWKIIDLGKYITAGSYIFPKITGLSIDCANLVNVLKQLS